MTTAVVLCGRLFDGHDHRLLGPAEILIEGDTIAPFEDIAVTGKVDFVMKAGRVYRHGHFDIFQ